MADQIDIANDLALAENARAVAEARDKASQIPAGIAGDCDLCGNCLDLQSQDSGPHHSPPISRPRSQSSISHSAITSRISGSARIAAILESNLIFRRYPPRSRRHRSGHCFA